MIDKLGIIKWKIYKALNSQTIKVVSLPECYSRQIKGLTLSGDYDLLTGVNKVVP